MSTNPIARNWILFQNLRRDESHLVPKERLAILIVGRKKAIGQSFKSPAMFRRHCVPSLWFSKVQIVDGIKVHILSVPRKGRLPHAKVQIRSVHSVDWNAIIGIDVIQNRAQPIDVPDFNIRVGQSAWDIGAINWGHVQDVFPVVSLDVVVVKERRHGITWRVCHRFVFLDCHWLFLDVDLLVETLFSCYHLADWRWNC